MSKFKAGDEALVVDNTSLHEFQIGEVVTITSDDGNANDLMYTAKNPFDWWFVAERDLEPVVEPLETQDSVNHPSHYNQDGIECIEAIRASLGPDGFQAYCKGNCMKYLWRYEYKNGLEDLKKAQVYLNWMVESMETKGED